MATSIHAPWRMEYLRSLQKDESGDQCFLCQASQTQTDEQRKKLLVLWCTDHCVVMINKFPYTNGHLLIAPKAHIADMEQLDDAAAMDLTKQTAEAIKLLKRAMSPQGFNVGINLGRAAGAGVPGHLHQHVVARWGGDTNFMSVVGDVRVVPQAMNQVWEELTRLREQGRGARGEGREKEGQG
jgi:ATP adenylyltransferase